MEDKSVNTDVTGEEEVQTDQIAADGVMGTSRDEANAPTSSNGSNDNSEDTAEQGANWIPQARFNQVNMQKKEAIEQLKAVADSMVEDVPEAYRDIVPDLPPAEKITWIRNATKKGIFNSNVDSLDTKRPGGKPPTDFSKMSPEAMIASGYKK